MIISLPEFIVLLVAIVADVAFIGFTLARGKMKIIHKLYFCLLIIVLIWLIALVSLHYVTTEQIEYQHILDCVTQVVAFASPLLLLISIAFTTSAETLRWPYYLLFVIPLLTNLIAWSDCLFGTKLLYKEFALTIDDIIFGPYFYVHTIFSYACIAASVIITLRFGFKNSKTLYMRQAIIFAVGNLFPLFVSTLATLKIVPATICTTAYAYAFGTLILHGIAIFKYHMMDIRPMALQQVLDWITDGYISIAENFSVISFNKPFSDVFGVRYGIQEGLNIEKCLLSHEDEPGAFDFLDSIKATRESKAPISYEQAVTGQDAVGEPVKTYYMVEITPLLHKNKIVGFTAFFKDVTKIKNSMEKLQDSQNRLMEQERLASLGQMVGGIAHNLKTPIMSVSGSVLAIENLITEANQSLGDPDVTPDDYREIYGEANDWLSKIKDSCAYMSDIISTVRGQAANMTSENFEEMEFAVSDMLKRSSLLMRHELVRNKCHLESVNECGYDVMINGDINNMVQVINNLVSNSIDAQCETSTGKIEIKFSIVGKDFKITVIDDGCGIPPKIKNALTNRMVTSKGKFGTGLGVFFSSSIIKGKFGGSMVYDDNPSGGTIVTITLPPESYSTDKLTMKGVETNA